MNVLVTNELIRALPSAKWYNSVLCNINSGKKP